MKTNFLCRALMMLLCFSCIMGCSKDSIDPNSFERLVSIHQGEYKLEAVHWSGLAVDFDNDGFARWELLDTEMKNTPGYFPYNHGAMVEEELHEKLWGTHPYMNVLARIPYPYYESTDEGYKVKYIVYLPVSIQMVYYGELSSSIINNLGTQGEKDIFMSGVEEIQITEFLPDSFTIRVRCTMYAISQEKTTNYMYYKYRKI